MRQEICQPMQHHNVGNNACGRVGKLDVSKHSAEREAVVFEDRFRLEQRITGAKARRDKRIDSDVPKMIVSCGGGL